MFFRAVSSGKRAGFIREIIGSLPVVPFFFFFLLLYLFASLRLYYRRSSHVSFAHPLSVALFSNFLLRETDALFKLPFIRLQRNDAQVASRFSFLLSSRSDNGVSWRRIHIQGIFIRHHWRYHSRHCSTRFVKE